MIDPAPDNAPADPTDADTLPKRGPNADADARVTADHAPSENATTAGRTAESTDGSAPTKRGSEGAARADRSGAIDATDGAFALPGWAVRTFCAVVGGLLLFASFPPRPFWFLAPIAVALLIVAVRGTAKTRASFGYGMLGGLAFFLPLLPWTGIYVGPTPWLALSTACAVFFGLWGVLTRLLSTLPGWPVWVALAWTATEWARSTFPFGGFPWGRIAFGQADGWYLSLAAYGGAPLIGFAVALTGAGLVALVSQLRTWTRTRDFTHIRTGLALALVTVAIMPIAGAILRTTLPTSENGYRSITVAAIQGSVPRLGLDFNAQRRAVLDNHVRRTEELADAVKRGQVAKPDVVIWPENSSDIDPLRNADARAEITQASVRIGAPILVGAVLVNGDRTTTNSVIVWDGTHGPGDRHNKKIIQPFGEYLPMRGFFRLFSSYADRAGYFVPGDGDGTVTAAGVRIGVATCYEVAFDRAFRDSLAAGAQLLTVPTNNATFGESEMTYQQLAMSRVRAVEHGRALVVAATTGVSAIITANGEVAQQSQQVVPAALVAQLPLRDTTTVATRMGAGPEIASVILTALGLGLVGYRRYALARKQSPNALSGRVSE
ncbi:apolipoprotein N-acyltransferase [Nocardia camponoti]|uniref:Apolipoprotein N-acyltransferase n=1 Tax=Nocardia camponoti TaxID=1616106 RepID=A0A917Q9D5_9NOCA|nr:apolipoprotein N-acyltransferase [Nocardia camponoti]GGK36824.1 apolipoprotein N-acyltransferase [Nocardia camponoti]